MTCKDKVRSYQMSVEVPLAERIANFLLDDSVFQHFIQMLDARCRVFNEFLRHPLDMRLGNENVYDICFDRRGRTKKNINIAITEFKFCISSRSFFNILTSEVACSGWLNDMLGSSWMSFDMEIFFIECCPETSRPQLFRNMWFDCGGGDIRRLFRRLYFNVIFRAWICGVSIVAVSFSVVRLLRLFKLHKLNDRLRPPPWFIPGWWLRWFEDCFHS